MANIEERYFDQKRLVAAAFEANSGHSLSLQAVGMRLLDYCQR